MFGKRADLTTVSLDDSRPGALAPVNFAESVIHAAADAAVDRLNAVLGAHGGARDSFLKGADGRALRNVLRRYALHAVALSEERGE